MFMDCLHIPAINAVFNYASTGVYFMLIGGAVRELLRVIYERGIPFEKFVFGTFFRFSTRT